MSRTRKTASSASLRNKIAAVLLSLVALWAFAAYVTVGEGVSVVWYATLQQQVAKPLETVVGDLQEERRTTVEFIAHGGSSPTSALLTARTDTDNAVAALRQHLGRRLAQWSTSGDTDSRLTDLLRALDGLPSRRSDMDVHLVDRVSAESYFTSLVQLGSNVYDTFTVWNDSRVIDASTTLFTMTQMQELISQEDSMLTGVIADSLFADTDRTSFAQLVGVQHFVSKQIGDRLTGTDRAEYIQLLESPPMLALQATEDHVINAPTGHSPIADPAQWQSTVTNALGALRSLISTMTDTLVNRFRPYGVLIVVRLILAAGLGLVAVIASIRFVIRTLRTLQKQLAELRVAALDLAHERLPGVVERLRVGEDVDVADAAPPLEFGDDDIGQVGQAFNAVQQTAIQATVDQAELRRGVRDVFLNLAHRIQTLVHRQLKLIDGMERQAVTDDELAKLFRIDHLATRMRRNAENLIVLAGVPASRGWRAPVPMVDVLRAALAEVEDYPRVKLRGAEPVAVAGHAAGDLIHLLAELMENAVSFSPPQTIVQVTGEWSGGDYLVEIEDRGLGMLPSDMADANERIADPPEFQLSSTARLGFYVVGRLAGRHGIQVRLRRSIYDGVTGSVIVPAALLSDDLGESGRPRERFLAAVTSDGFNSSDPKLGSGVVQPLTAQPPLPPAPPTTTATSVTATPDQPGSPTAEQARLTPAGLPWRARKPHQTAPVQRTPEQVTVEQPTSTFPNGRTPAEISRMMAAFVKSAHDGRKRAEQADE